MRTHNKLDSTSSILQAKFHSHTASSQSKAQCALLSTFSQDERSFHSSAIPSSTKPPKHRQLVSERRLLRSATPFCCCHWLSWCTCMHARHSMIAVSNMNSTCRQTATGKECCNIAGDHRTLMANGCWCRCGCACVLARLHVPLQAASRFWAKSI